MSNKNNTFLNNLSTLLQEIEQNPEVIRDMSDYILSSLKNIAVNMQLYKVATILRDEERLRQENKES